MQNPIHGFREICEVLDEYYPNPEIPLDFTNAYTLLVAVVLSAQCTDRRVNEVTPNLWQFGTRPSDMVALGVEKISNLIRSCGLYRRKAEAIYALSERLSRDFGDDVPRDRESLESLPGVGRKTANVLLSHVFHVPAFAVDTHVMRLANRWQWSSASTPNLVERDLCQIFPPEQWTKRHLQMIYFGRNVCKARGHVAAECPACSCLL